MRDSLFGKGVASVALGTTTACVAASEVVEVRRALEVLAGRVVGAGSGASRAQWAGLVSACQSLVNTATAVQDVAITRLAAVEEEWLEDGTTVESGRAAGHVALDAPDVVAGALGVSHVHAQRRVALAVRLVADAGDGGVLDGRVVGGAGLSVLHAAMLGGGLDGYRAGVVVEELAEAPPEVAQAVVGVLVPHLGVETAVQLRARCRRALARISPDLLRQRATRAREACGLHRWAEEPGVDRWEGTFPSEQAAEGWAAVDALARRYVAEGRCVRVEAARAQALMDLVRGQASIEVQLVVTVPAGVVSDAAAGTAGTALPASSHVSSGERRSADLGCAMSKVSAWPLTVGDDAASVASDEDLVDVSGLFPGDPVLVGRGWIRSFLADPTRSGTQASGRTRRARPAATALQECHPVTGALLGTGLRPGRAYRPGRRIAALVRARDGRCRFPGCSVAARFCDLDHVRPWPAGPTSAANLLCLCRRHHRIKQRPGWSVRLHPDARAVWTDPTGRERTTWPRNLLDPVVLPAGPTSPSVDVPPAAPAASVVLRDGTPAPGGQGGSHLEVYLGVLTDHARCRSSRPRAPNPQATPLDTRVWLVLPAPCRVAYDAGGRPDHRPGAAGSQPGGRRRDAAGTGPPPF